MTAKKVELSEDEYTRAEVLKYFPVAYVLPYPEIGCIQVVTGTGYVLGWAKTEPGAWKEALRLILAMDEGEMRRIIAESVAAA